MSTDKMPAQPTTKELPAADPVLVALADLSREVRGTRADIALVANDVSIVKDRVAVVESRVLTLEDARKVTSMRVKEASSVDLEHESRLATEIVARQELAAKLDALTESQALQLAVLGRLDKFAANPNIKIILAVIATALASWATSKGLGK